MGVNPKLAGDSGTTTDLSWENFIKEVFLDSDTSIGLKVRRLAPTTGKPWCRQKK